MIDIMFLTDIHGNYAAAQEAIKNEDPDFILLGGDITDLGQDIEGVVPFVDDMPAPTFVIPGNCDMRKIVPALDSSSAISLHQKTIDIDDITFAGFGGSNPSPFSTPFENSEEERAKAATETIASMKQNRWNILITHAPPYGVLDLIGSDVHVGCHAVANIAPKFDIICCGHIHEMKGTAKLGNTLCVNPGPAKDGNYALIHLETDEELIIELKNIYQ